MSPEKRWIERVVSLGCVICYKLERKYVPAEYHHVAEASGLRSDFAGAGLCREHHVGATGFHTLGTKRFCSLFRIPGESEYGLLVLVNEMLARNIGSRGD